MTQPAKLADIVDGMDMQNEFCSAYLDRATGRIEIVTEDDRALLDISPDELEDSDQERFELIQAIENDTAGRFVPLPDRFEIHEWEMMKRFAIRLEDAEASDALLNAIHGRGAFRYFKDKIREFGVVDQWFAYRDEQYRAVARGWCEQHEIEIAAKSGEQRGTTNA